MSKEELIIGFFEKGYCCDLDEIKDTCLGLLKENQKLKQKLNWIAFGDDAELALRYLRKIGYVDFDEERKVYINKHNNEPFLLDDEEEKAYYIKSEELNEYTKQLEYQNTELKKQLEERNIEYFKGAYDTHNKCYDQQQEFIKWLEDKIERKRKNATCTFEYNDTVLPLKEVLQKYKEIIGGKHE